MARNKTSQKKVDMAKEYDRLGASIRQAVDLEIGRLEETIRRKRAVQKTLQNQKPASGSTR